MARALIYRKGWLAFLSNFILALVGLGGLVFYQLILTTLAMNPENPTETRGLAGAASVFVYLIGIIVIPLLMVWYRQDLRRWFPQKSQPTKVPVQQPKAAS